MSRIDKHNYEAYYLDYTEGRLDPDTVQELLDFLDAHPDLKAELEDFEVLQLNPDTVSGFDKEALKQHIDEENVEDYIIASIENVIDEEDALELDAFLKNSEEARKLRARYQKTILSGPEVSYPGKNALKKQSSAVYYLIPLAAAAAVALLVLIVNPFETNRGPTPIASTDSTGIYEQEQPEIISEKIAPDVEVQAQISRQKGLNEEIEIQKESLVYTEPERNIAEYDIEQTDKPDDQPEPLQGLPEPEYRDAYRFENIEPKTMESLANVSENDLSLPVSDIIRPVAESEMINTDLATAGTDPEMTITKKRGLNILRVAEIGVKTFGMLNERNYALERHYTDTGELESVTLVTNRRRITTEAI